MELKLSQFIVAWA